MATYPKVVFETVTFEKTQIKSAQLVEEFNPISVTVPACTLTLEVYIADPSGNGFTIIDPGGLYSVFEYRAPLMLYEVIDGVNTFIGRYYLDTWKNLSDNILELVCMDELGLLDTLTYRGGMYTSATPVSTIVADIFSGITLEYTLDPDLGDVELIGWIPIGSYREAIQQVMFAAGGYVLAARQQGIIKFGIATSRGIVTRGLHPGISGYSGDPKSAVTTRAGGRLYQQRFRESQWEGVESATPISNAQQTAPAVKLRTQVTKVDVSMHDITAGDAERRLFYGSLEVGTYEIQFSQPMHSLSIIGGSIVSSGANYALISVDPAATVTLEGKVYNDTITNDYYPKTAPPEKENIITVPEGSLINSSNGLDTAQRIYEYYQNRHTHETKLIQPEVYIGKEVVIDSLYGRQIQGFIEKMTLDLTGGMVGKTTIVGNPVDDPVNHLRTLDIYTPSAVLDKPTLGQ